MVAIAQRVRNKNQTSFLTDSLCLWFMFISYILYECIQEHCCKTQVSLSIATSTLNNSDHQGKL